MHNPQDRIEKQMKIIAYSLHNIDLVAGADEIKYCKVK
jgi:hypothetical protein